MLVSKTTSTRPAEVLDAAGHVIGRAGHVTRNYVTCQENWYTAVLRGSSVPLYFSVSHKFSLTFGSKQNGACPFRGEVPPPTFTCVLKPHTLRCLGNKQVNCLICEWRLLVTRHVTMSLDALTVCDKAELIAVNREEGVAMATRVHMWSTSSNR